MRLHNLRTNRYPPKLYPARYSGAKPPLSSDEREASFTVVNGCETSFTLVPAAPGGAGLAITTRPDEW